jgi:hypothetical protein
MQQDRATNIHFIHSRGNDARHATKPFIAWIRFFSIKEGRMSHARFEEDNKR